MDLPKGLDGTEDLNEEDIETKSNATQATIFTIGRA